MADLCRRPAVLDSGVPLSCGASPSAAALTPALSLPLVGALIGLFTSAAIPLGDLFWPASIAVSSLSHLNTVLTGALHEDAVADFCDAFGGGRTRDQS